MPSSLENCGVVSKSRNLAQLQITNQYELTVVLSILLLLYLLSVAHVYSGADLLTVSAYSSYSDKIKLYMYSFLHNNVFIILY